MLRTIWITGQQEKIVIKVRGAKMIYMKKNQDSIARMSEEK